MHITKDNIDEFIYRTIMNCDNYGITGIDYIPEGITTLLCLGNKLTELPHLPEGLVVLNCYNNQLTELPKLPESLIVLNCESNNLPYKITIDNYKEHNKLIKRKEILKRICT